MSDMTSAFGISIGTSSNNSSRISIEGDVKSQITSLTPISTNLSSVNSAGSAAIEAVVQNLEKIQNVGTTTTSVKLGALLGEIAPMSIDILSLGDFLLDGIDRLSKNLLGNSTKTTAAAPAFKDVPADVVEKLTGSKGVSSALTGFSTIRSYATTAQVFSGVLTVAQTVMKVIETILPIAEITADLALTLWSCGTSTAKAGSELTEVIEDLCQRLVALALEALRKFIFNLKIQVPSYLVGSLNTLNLSDAMRSRNTPTWLEDVFDEEFYRSALTSDTWEVSISRAIKKIQPRAEEIPYNYTRTRGDLLKELFTAELVKNFMEESTKIARKKAQIINYENLDWNYYDNAILKVNTPKEDTSYTILDSLLVKNLQESPITDEESIILISKNVLDKMS